MEEKILYIDEQCKCYKYKDKLRFQLIYDDIPLGYTLSGHPTMPSFEAKCDNNKYSYSEQGGMRFPNDTEEGWSDFSNVLKDKLTAVIGDALEEKSA